MFSYIKGNTDLLSQNLSDKKVLVLGSGPSSREVDWTSADWDVLVTTSFFYLNDEVLLQNPIHVTLSDIVDLDNPKLIKYLDENKNVTIAFEPKVHPFYETESYKNFVSKYESRMIYYNVLGGKEGVAGRLCWLVLACEPSKLLICGIDGVSQNRESDPQNYFRGHIGTMDDYSYDTYLKSFEIFGTRLYELGNQIGIQINNLGKGKPYNMISNISNKFEK